MPRPPSSRPHDAEAGREPPSHASGLAPSALIHALDDLHSPIPSTLTAGRIGLDQPPVPPAHLTSTSGGAAAEGVRHLTQLRTETLERVHAELTESPDTRAA